ncbi:MAG: TrkA family potassium uptake protein [Candidatus Aenigmatarchaeota archaeon]
MGYVVIYGAGHFGRGLIDLFLDEGWQVCVIDGNENVCYEITEIYGIRSICGEAIDPEILDEAEIYKADIFIAATPRDERNIVASFLAREKGVKKIVVRVSNESYKKIVEKSGFIYTFPEEIGAKETFWTIVHPNIKNIKKFSDFYLCEIEADKNLLIIGKKFEDIEDKNVKIIYYSEENVLKEYKPNEVIREGMRLYILTTKDPLKILQNWQI